MAESLVKQLTGGDTVAARFLHKEFFEYQPNFKIFLICNYRPVISGQDHGIWRRIRMVPFRVIIPEDEQDKRLAERLRKEWPGILRWTVKGCLEWQGAQGADGLGEPKQIIEATQEYRQEMDQIGQFIEDRCVLRPGAAILSSKLFEDYLSWCKRQGVSADSRTGFGRAMGRRRFGKGKDPEKRRVTYLGLTLRPSGQGEGQSKASKSTG